MPIDDYIGKTEGQPVKSKCVAGEQILLHNYVNKIGLSIDLRRRGEVFCATATAKEKQIK